MECYFKLKVKIKQKYIDQMNISALSKLAYKRTILKYRKKSRYSSLATFFFKFKPQIKKFLISKWHFSKK